MIKLLNEWKRYLKEDINEIRYVSGSLRALIKTYPKIISLHIPGWSMEYWYKHPKPHDLGVVAIDGDIPVGMIVIRNSEEHPSGKPPILNSGYIGVFINPDYRNKRLAKILFEKILKKSSYYKTLGGSLRCREMLEDAGFKDTGRTPYQYDDGKYFINPYFKEQK